jgi:hypothetical protein
VLVSVSVVAESTVAPVFAAVAAAEAEASVGPVRAVSPLPAPDEPLVEEPLVEVEPVLVLVDVLAACFFACLCDFL